MPPNPVVGPHFTERTLRLRGGHRGPGAAGNGRRFLEAPRTHLKWSLGLSVLCAPGRELPWAFAPLPWLSESHCLAPSSAFQMMWLRPAPLCLFTPDPSLRVSRAIHTHSSLQAWAVEPWSPAPAPATGLAFGSRIVGALAVALSAGDRRLQLPRPQRALPGPLLPETSSPWAGGGARRLRGRDPPSCLGGSLTLAGSSSD